MAPEMAMGEAIDYRADIYELGVVLYTLLDGHVPFAGSNSLAVITRHLRETLPLLHSTRPEIPPGVDAVIQKATAKDRTQRYSSVQAMAQDLHAAIERPASYSARLAQGEDMIPTMVQPAASPMILSHTPPSGMGTYDATPTTMASPMNAEPSNLQVIETPPVRRPIPAQRGAWWRVPLLVLCALALVLAGVVTGTQLLKNKTATTATVTPTVQPTQTTTAKQTPTVAPTATATVKPTAQPTATPATAATPATGVVPTGQLLYSAAAPGPACDTGGGTWEVYNGARINCQGKATQIINTATSKTLQGLFLTGISGKNYPNDYVLEVDLQQDQNSNSSFGLYFRNQPGSLLGTYTFLVEPDGSWRVAVYDNTTGIPKAISQGTFGDIHAASKVAVVIKGSQFSFYANGKSLGNVSDATYASGTAGLAVDQGGTISASNFAIYATA
ncbi:serine/threonine protein kinase [Dictyobacter kobayashii]|uniref:Protein kinase domain-containing protein n=1 Tax=Dictyobacter kobayashii TaxID=2014872 RepID=A0A402ABS5_9CHLR|nr:hypothetical protein [Dictyobacter kobayashii]GCE16546.1 hypothetical protein KDK_03460 [Dictyobacter kobayashii]